MGIAPEVIRKDKHTTATDIWSMGVIFYNMITGRIPFKATDKYALMHKIASQTVEVTYPPKFPSSFHAIIEACLRFEPDRRPTAHQLLGQLTSLTVLSESLSSGAPGGIKMVLVELGDQTVHTSEPLSLNELNSTQNVSKTSMTVHDSQPVS